MLQNDRARNAQYEEAEKLCWDGRGDLGVPSMSGQSPLLLGTLTSWTRPYSFHIKIVIIKHLVCINERVMNGYIYIFVCIYISIYLYVCFPQDHNTVQDLSSLHLVNDCNQYWVQVLWEIYSKEPCSILLTAPNLRWVIDYSEYYSHPPVQLSSLTMFLSLVLTIKVSVLVFCLLIVIFENIVCVHSAPIHKMA